LSNKLYIVLLKPIARGGQTAGRASALSGYLENRTLWSARRRVPYTGLTNYWSVIQTHY